MIGGVPGRARRFALAAVLLVTAEACADGTGPGSPPGLYILRAVDGISVPVIIASDVGYTEEMLSGEVRLEEDGTFVDVTAMRITSEGTVRIDIVEASGTWRREGGDIVFQTGAGGSYLMALSGRSLIQNWLGFELLYSK